MGPAGGPDPKLHSLRSLHAVAAAMVQSGQCGTTYLNEMSVEAIAIAK